MKASRLAYCDSSIMERWAVNQVALKTRRRCREDLEKILIRDVRILTAIQSAGVRLACTVNAAAHIVTEFYKGDPPFTGDVKQFMVRKSLAREAATALRRSVVLLSPGRLHFEKAEELWWELCDKEVRQSFVQFEDDIEAALILAPPEQTVVTQVLVSHHHLEYLLNRKSSPALIQLLGAWGW